MPVFTKQKSPRLLGGLSACVYVEKTLHHRRLHMYGSIILFINDAPSAEHVYSISTHDRLVK